MPFVEAITKLRSLSIVGMAKNAGKTETLNYILGRLADYPSLSVAVTSIGIDGEKEDQVTQTAKPEITLSPGTLFVTAESYYRRKMLPAEVCDIDTRIVTPIGRAIYARARGKGKILLAGPSSNLGLRLIVERMKDFQVDLTIIDGALSRMSLASPSVAEGIVLATGASFSANPDTLIRGTKALYRLIKLPALEDPLIVDQLSDVENEIYLLGEDNKLYPTGYSSALMMEAWEALAKEVKAKALFIPGVVTDTMLKRLQSKEIPMLLVKDFTRIYATPQGVASFFATGKDIKVLYATKLMAITFNPQAPNGYKLHSEAVCQRLQEELGIPVYDVRRIKM